LEHFFEVLSVRTLSEVKSCASQDLSRLEKSSRLKFTVSVRMRVEGTLHSSLTTDRNSSSVSDFFIQLFICHRAVSQHYFVASIT
jgi:hypothetical protein